MKNESTGQVVLVSAQHTFGRGKYCNTVLSGDDISRSHAKVFWRNKQWFLRDHSRNGTMVDDKNVNQTEVVLGENNLLKFGDADVAKWKIIDLSAPSSYFKSIDDEEIIQLISCQVYPNTNCPEVSFYQLENYKWFLENNTDTLELIEGRVYDFSNKKWVFVENEMLVETIEMTNHANKAFFQFQISLDEEHVHTKIIFNDLIIDLEERVHHHLLLLLVNIKCEDLRENIEADDCGWVLTEVVLTKLSKELMKTIDEYYLNVIIYRIRKQFLQHKPFGPKFIDVIERKHGKIRFNHPYYKIIKGTEIIEEVLPKNFN